MHVAFRDSVLFIFRDEAKRRVFVCSENFKPARARLLKLGSARFVRSSKLGLLSRTCSLVSYNDESQVGVCWTETKTESLILSNSLEE
jgi:hypothetical protein